MLKKLVLTTAIGGLMISGAMAQTATPSTTPSTSATPMPSTSATPMPSASTAPKFISAQSSSQWVTSKFNGTDVLGPNNEHIGDVSDMLFTKEGQIQAYIVGVGGFLGIGEKNVAIDPAAFQVVPADSNSTDPANVKLKVSWTKDQLKQAPSFQYYKEPSRTTSTAPATNTGIAPRPATPPASR